MAIKAIMCDVDGTLLNSQGVVSPYTIEQIKKIKAQGVLFGLATGRDVHGRCGNRGFSAECGKK